MFRTIAPNCRVLARLDPLHLKNGATQLTCRCRIVTKVVFHQIFHNVRWRLATFVQSAALDYSTMPEASCKPADLSSPKKRDGCCKRTEPARVGNLRA